MIKIKFRAWHYGLQPLKNLADFDEICGQAIGVLLTMKELKNYGTK